MPHRRCFGGNVRQAIAMTTALSPDRMTLTKMIWTTPIQNGACVMSCHKKSTANLCFPFTAPCGGGSAALPPTAAISRIWIVPGQPQRSDTSAHDIVAAEELGDLLHGRVGSVGTVHRVLADRLGVNLADRAGRGLGGIGRAHEVAVAGDRVLALQHLHHHRAG